MQAINPWGVKLNNHLKLCLANVTHNFKWVKITHICNNLRPNICKYWCFKH